MTYDRVQTNHMVDTMTHASVHPLGHSRFISILDSFLSREHTYGSCTGIVMYILDSVIAWCVDGRTVRRLGDIGTTLYTSVE